MKGGILAAEPRRWGKRESQLHWGLWQLKVISVYKRQEKAQILVAEKGNKREARLWIPAEPD
jgi:hypothetical protein